MEIQEENRTKRRPGFSWPAKMAGMVVLGIIGAITLAFLFGYFVMLLWNWLIVDTFGWLSEPITYWQAFGVVLLAKLLFGSFGHHKHDHHDKFHRHDRRYHTKKCREGSSNDYFRKWRYYDEYWNSEGEAAFDDYVKRKTGAEQENSEME